MGKIIAIANQKGGVGKTTTAVNLSAALGYMGHSCLLVDIDPQGNATSGVGINKRDVKKSAYDLLINKDNIDDIILKTAHKNLDLLPSNISLAGAEIELVDIAQRDSRLKNALSKVRDKYEYIFIDCPPSLGLITLNGLAAADTALIPIQCEFFALEGLAQLIATIRQIKKLYNPHLEIEGVLLTMYDNRLNLTVQVVNEVKKFFPQKVFSSVIPRNVRLSEAPSHGKAILYYDRGSKGAEAYNKLAKELVDINKKGLR